MEIVYKVKEKNGKMVAYRAIDWDPALKVLKLVGDESVKVLKSKQFQKEVVRAIFRPQI